MATIADAMYAYIKQATVTALVTNSETGETIEMLEVYPGTKGKPRLLVNLVTGLAIASTAEGQAAVTCARDREVLGHHIAQAAARALQKVMSGQYDQETIYTVVER